MSVSANILDENSRNLRKEVLSCDDEIESPINDDDEEFPTTSIRVLLVDADSNSLLLMTNLMAQYSYQVTKYDNGEEAMAFLMKSKHEIDLVLWDFHMPDINGLDALNTIGKEMDLPVVIMSHDHKKETVMASTKNGACDFLVKPVSKEVVAVVWQHVYRKRMSKSGLVKPGESYTVESDSDEYEGLLREDNLYQSNGEGSKNTCDQREDTSSAKKPRMKWSAELHQKFEAAVEKIGSVEKAYPKQILKCMQEDMNVQGLTRNNVASHLQKYRQSSNKKTSTPQETQEDFDWCNTGLDPPDLAASNPPLSSTRAPYFMNNFQAAAVPKTSYFTTDQTAPPIPYLSNGYNLPMNNKNNYFMASQFQQPLQQQQYQYPCLNLPSILTKQESGHVSSAMETSDTLIYNNSSFPNFDHDEYFLPAEFTNNNNHDQFPPAGLNNNRDHQFPLAGMNHNHDQFSPAGMNNNNNNNNNNRDQFPPAGLNNNNRDQFPPSGLNNTRDQFPPSGLNNTRDQFPPAGFNNNFDQTCRN